MLLVGHRLTIHCADAFADYPLNSLLNVLVAFVEVDPGGLDVLSPEKRICSDGDLLSANVALDILGLANLHATLILIRQSSWSEVNAHKLLLATRLGLEVSRLAV